MSPSGDRRHRQSANDEHEPGKRDRAIAASRPSGGGGNGTVIDVLLADDHPLILRGLREVLGAYSDLRVVGAESDALEVMNAARRLRPDVLVIDYSMPGRSGADIVRELCETQPGTRALILSMHSSASYVSDALNSGALGYVLKSAESEEIARAIRTVHEGRLYLSPPLLDGSADAGGSSSRDRASGGAAGAPGAPGAPSGTAEWREDAPPGAAGEGGSLTKRELEVLSLVVVGHTSGEIAERLRIGRRTVESHRASLMAKLGARNQIDLVREAVRRGLASFEDED